MSTGVCAYSFNTGYDAYQLMDMAVENGLSGVEFPPDSCLPDLSPETLQKARAYAEERNLFIVTDGGQVELEMFKRLIPAANALGSATLRVVMSGVLGGDRRPLSGRWRAHLKECRDILRGALPLADDHGVSIALENHSDATSHDMLWMCEVLDSNYIGITLDVGNVLAVCEEPLGYTERLMPHLRNIHLKDYTLHPTEEGYRMARCALGQGVVDFPNLLSMINEHHTEITKTIELGAIFARHARMLADDYWAEYPDRDIREMLPFLRLYWEHVQPRDKDWRTPKEREESADALLAYETREFKESVAYLKTIGEA